MRCPVFFIMFANLLFVKAKIFESCFQSVESSVKIKLAQFCFQLKIKAAAMRDWE